MDTIDRVGLATTRGVIRDANGQVIPRDPHSWPRLVEIVRLNPATMPGLETRVNARVFNTIITTYFNPLRYFTKNSDFDKFAALLKSAAMRINACTTTPTSRMTLRRGRQRKTAWRAPPVLTPGNGAATVDRAMENMAALVWMSDSRT